MDFSFSPLKPFPDKTGNSDFSYQIFGRVLRSKNCLKFEFLLEGDLSSVYFPKSNHPNQRKDGLWKTTCFEAFFSEKAQLSYWEVNASPSGDWNWYFFKNYREMQATENRADLSLNRHSLVNGQFSFQLVFPDNRLTNQPLEVGLCAVMQEKNSKTSYWALEHSIHKPDFHVRSTFVLSI